MKSKNRKRQTERKAPDKLFGAILADRINTRRLREYAKWLLKCVPEKSFNFNHFYRKPDSAAILSDADALWREPAQLRPVNCGTVGCFLGHITKRYPNLRTDAVKNRELFHPNDISGSFHSSFYVRKAFQIFNIKTEMSYSLFYPGAQKQVSSRLPLCDADASKKQVCDMVLLFCDLYDRREL